jgi:hypothetical protein
LFLFSCIIAPCSCSCFFIFLFHVLLAPISCSDVLFFVCFLAPIHLLGPNLFPKKIISCLIHYIFIVHVAM